MIRQLLVLGCLAASILSAQGPIVSKSDLDLSIIRRLPVLEGERYKPLDSMAREWFERITGKDNFRDTDAVLFFLHVRYEFEKTRAVPLVKIHRAPKVRSVGIIVESAAEDHLSFDALAALPLFLPRVQEIEEKRRDNLDLIDDERDIAGVASRWSMLASFGGADRSSEGGDPELRGYLPCIPPAVPPAAGTRYVWGSPADLQRAGWRGASADAVAKAFKDLRQSYLANDGPGFSAASTAVLESVAALGYPKNAGDLSFPGMATMDREVRLNRLAPFKHAWYIYFLAALFALGAALSRGLRGVFPILLGLAVLTALGAFSYHVFGIVERTALSGRAMIGTFYESFVFVSGASMLVGLIFELIFRMGWFLMTGAALASSGLFVATKNPDFFNPPIENLSAVLINNDWIHIHVPTIMLAYSVLALAAGLGALWLVIYSIAGANSEGLTRLAKTMFWLIPVGEILLFSGIILGAIWADASWGRAWGWDPKEVGALILWLCYMVVIHGRWTGWLRDFGTAMGCLVGILALGWSYYGTNFFWVGLHSYAAAGGGRSVPTWMFWLTGSALLIAAVATIRWFDERGATRRMSSQGGGAGSPDAVLLK